MCEKGEKTVTVSKGRDASCLCAGVRQEQGMRVKRSLIVWRRGTCVDQCLKIVPGSPVRR